MTIKTFLQVGDGSALSNLDSGRQHVVKKTIDCSANNITSGDIVKLMNVPADVLVQDVIVNVKTAEGNTLTIDVGDYLTATDAAVDADGFIDGVDGNAVAATKASSELSADTTTLTYSSGKFYPAANSYIGALFNNDAEAAVIDVIFVLVKC